MKLDKETLISLIKEVMLDIPQPEHMLDLEIQHIIDGYKIEYKTSKAPTREQFMDFYKQHSQVNQAVIRHYDATIDPITGEKG